MLLKKTLKTKPKKAQVCPVHLVCVKLCAGY